MYSLILNDINWMIKQFSRNFKQTRSRCYCKILINLTNSITEKLHIKKKKNFLNLTKTILIAANEKTD